MVLAYYFLAIAIMLLLSHKFFDYILHKKEDQEFRLTENNIYAHEIVMEMGEILTRLPTQRYPDMETNQAKVKQYYQRVKDSPVKIGNTKQANLQSVKPVLVSVK